jgi:hypothetical protein
LSCSGAVTKKLEEKKKVNQVYSSNLFYLTNSSRFPASIENQILDRKGLRKLKCELEKVDNFIKITSIEKQLFKTINSINIYLNKNLPRSAKFSPLNFLGKNDLEKIVSLASLNFYCNNFTAEEIKKLSKIRVNPVIEKYFEFNSSLAIKYVSFLKGYLYHIKSNKNEFKKYLLNKKTNWPYNYLSNIRKGLSLIK